MGPHKDKKWGRHSFRKYFGDHILKVWNRANSCSMKAKASTGYSGGTVQSECISAFPRKSYREMNHQPSVCFATFPQAHDGKQLRKPPQVSRQLSTSPIHFENGGNGHSSGRFHVLAMVCFQLVKNKTWLFSEAISIPTNYREWRFWKIILPQTALLVQIWIESICRLS